MHVFQFGNAPAASPSLLLIADRTMALSTAALWGDYFGENFLLYIPDASLPASEAVPKYVDVLLKSIEKNNIKRTTVLGIGPGASIAMALAVRAPRIVRRLVLLDGTSRIAPSSWECLLDRIEENLPLGLPFRSISKRFDARPMLHLIRCPALVLRSRSGDLFLDEQSHELAQRIPNSWLCVLNHPPFTSSEEEGLDAIPSDELLQKVDEFLQLPVKRPQKAKKAARA